MRNILSHIVIAAALAVASAAFAQDDCKFSEEYFKEEAGNAEVLYIYPEGYYPAMKVAKVLRDSEGRTAILKSVTEIEWDPRFASGQNIQEKIRMAEAYFAVNNGVKYTTLWGNVNKIPTNYVGEWYKKGEETEGTLGFSGESEVDKLVYRASDFSYADILDANGQYFSLDQNGNGIPGEYGNGGLIDQVDGNPDLIVSRVPAANLEECLTYLVKMIEYELGSSVDPQALNKVLMNIAKMDMDESVKKDYDALGSNLQAAGNQVEHLDYKLINDEAIQKYEQMGFNAKIEYTASELHKELGEGYGVFINATHGNTNLLLSLWRPDLMDSWSYKSFNYNSVSPNQMVWWPGLIPVFISDSCHGAEFSPTVGKPYMDNDGNFSYHDEAMPPQPSPYQPLEDAWDDAMAEDLTVGSDTGSMAFIGASGMTMWGISQGLVAGIAGNIKPGSSIGEAFLAGQIGFKDFAKDYVENKKGSWMKTYSHYHRYHLIGDGTFTYGGSNLPDADKSLLRACLLDQALDIDAKEGSQDCDPKCICKDTDSDVEDSAHKFGEVTSINGSVETAVGDECADNIVIEYQCDAKGNIIPAGDVPCGPDELCYKGVCVPYEGSPDDVDSDGIDNEIDNCAIDSNEKQEDFDGDGIGDVCDEDNDNDGIPDKLDNCDYVYNPIFTDHDMDGMGDACDMDDDNDGIEDSKDWCPVDADPTNADSDGNGVGDVCEATEDSDDDGYLNIDDNCPFVFNPDQGDVDFDNEGDACDSDSDNDGVEDAKDNCKSKPNPDQENTDGDKEGDACDSDMDNDGVLNVVDNCPLMLNPLQEDADNDGAGDACDKDECKLDADGDKVCDDIDNCPGKQNPLQWDEDKDEIGNACDPDYVMNCNVFFYKELIDIWFCSKAKELGAAICELDFDGDGVPAGEDNCQYTVNSDQIDTDGDAMGDACDYDDDNDGSHDDFDCAPNDPKIKTGQPEICNGKDDNCNGMVDEECETGIDTDGDGYLNAMDNCPKVFNPVQQDRDGDGIGDHCDVTIAGGCKYAPCKKDSDCISGFYCGYMNRFAKYEINPQKICRHDGRAYHIINDTDIGWGCILYHSDYGRWASEYIKDECFEVPWECEESAPGVCVGGPSHVVYDKILYSNQALKKSPVPSFTKIPIGGYCTPGSEDFECEPGSCCRKYVAADKSEAFKCSHKKIDDHFWGGVYAVNTQLPEPPYCHTEYADDVDNDGIKDIADNCPGAYNPGQSDIDIDAIGDFCDPDMDGDEAANEDDNCFDKPNPDQADFDKDGAGDVCDFDIDNDEIINEKDNCDYVASYVQDDKDYDLIGDLCDPDIDGDGVPNEEDEYPEEKDPLDMDGDKVEDIMDNCPGAYNPSQIDSDLDGFGDICDPGQPYEDDKWDSDGDGTPDKYDDDPFNAAVAHDMDGDGVDDLAEGDDPAGGYDTDGDGTKDSDEGCAYCMYDPEDVEDSDGDGLGDNFEQKWSSLKDGAKLSVSLADKNYDGMPDGFDTDDDGLSDGNELVVSYNALTGELVTWQLFDPTKFDTDGNGIGDIDEFNNGCNVELFQEKIWGDIDKDGQANCYDSDADDDSLLNGLEISGGKDTLSPTLKTLLVTDPMLVDTDKDIVADNVDNCPNISNANQKDTFKKAVAYDGDKAYILGDTCDWDDDHDGVDDAYDCAPLNKYISPKMPELCNNKKDDDCDGLTDEDCSGDSDKDGIADLMDNCPYIPNTDQKNICKYFMNFIPALHTGVDGDNNDGCNCAYCEIDEHCNPGFKCINGLCQESSYMSPFKNIYNFCCLNCDYVNACDGLAIWKEDDDWDNDGWPNVYDKEPLDPKKWLAPGEKPADWDGDGLVDFCDVNPYVPDIPHYNWGKSSSYAAFEYFNPKGFYSNELMKDGCNESPGDNDLECNPDFGYDEDTKTCVPKGAYPELFDLYASCCVNFQQYCTDGMVWKTQITPSPIKASPELKEILGDLIDNNCNGVVDEAGGTNAGDPDKDGVGNNIDNCTGVKNPDQKDTDFDWQGDACDTDDDNDGVPDEEDNCPLKHNPEQTDTENDDIGDVCDSDFDNDGVDNKVDNCPSVYNTEQMDEVDHDGIGLACDDDNDNDGIKDKQDNCPFKVNPDQKDADGDKKGDACDVGEAGPKGADADGDGLADEKDNCPNTANKDQLNTDKDSKGNACDDDDDNDGYADASDCGPNDGNVNPGRPEVCNNGKDDNCNGMADDDCKTIYGDKDVDGYVGVVDCDDSDPTRNPGMAELCSDFKDNDCDGLVNEGCVPQAGPAGQDWDGDEVDDNVDNCIYIPNPGQEDSDKNGVGDICGKYVGKKIEKKWMNEALGDGCYFTNCGFEGAMNVCNPGLDCVDNVCVPGEDMPIYAALYHPCCLVRYYEYPAQGAYDNTVCESAKVWKTQYPCTDSDGDGVIDPNDVKPKDPKYCKDANSDGFDDCDKNHLYGYACFVEKEDCIANLADLKDLASSCSPSNKQYLTCETEVTKCFMDMYSQNPNLVSCLAVISQKCQYLSKYSGCFDWGGDIAELMSDCSKIADICSKISEGSYEYACVLEAGGSEEALGPETSGHAPMQDKDKDSVPDEKDNCPDIFNYDQKDSDWDKKGDVCDDDIDGEGIDIPETPPEEADEEVDSDGDKVDDKVDNCPNVANADQYDADKDGQGDACDTDDDDDNDGYIDTLDCAPGNSDVNPGKPETCNNGIDDNCNGQVDESCAGEGAGTEGGIPDEKDIPGEEIVDWDGEGVADPDDNCKFMPNPKQEDSDGDGTGDICEEYPDYNPIDKRYFCDSLPCKGAFECPPGFKCDGACHADWEDPWFKKYHDLYHPCCTSAGAIFCTDRKKIWVSQYQYKEGEACKYNQDCMAGLKCNRGVCMNLDDWDDDGIPYDKDNCPCIPNADQDPSSMLVKFCKGMDICEDMKLFTEGKLKCNGDECDAGLDMPCAPGLRCSMGYCKPFLNFGWQHFDELYHPCCGQIGESTCDGGLIWESQHPPQAN